MNVILAIDPSSKACGWATGQSSRDIQSGVWKPQMSWRSARETEAYRHSEICGRAALWLADLITEHGPSLIILEAGGGRMTDRCSERLRGALLATAYVREVALEAVHPSTWQAWARKNLGWSREHKSDEADAGAMLMWALAVRAPKVEAA